MDIEFIAQEVPESIRIDHPAHSEYPVLWEYLVLWEYPVLWTIIALTFVVRGGGQYSLDRLIGRDAIPEALRVPPRLEPLWENGPA